MSRLPPGCSKQKELSFEIHERKRELNDLMSQPLPQMDWQDVNFRWEHLASDFHAPLARR